MTCFTPLTFDHTLRTVTSLEDFFKDYPPVEGSFQEDLRSDPIVPVAPFDSEATSAFVLGDPIDGPEDGSVGGEDEETANGGPPPDDDAEPECPAVTKWRADFARRLEEKVRHEREVKAERTERAAKTLQTMHQRWDRSRRDAYDANKKTETELLRSRDSVISRMSKKGEQPNWNVVPELVDMSGKFKEGARDTSRMRQVILRMKTN